jgi:hypothetical protein
MRGGRGERSVGEEGWRNGGKERSKKGRAREGGEEGGAASPHAHQEAHGDSDVVSHVEPQQRRTGDTHTHSPTLAHSHSHKNTPPHDVTRCYQ